MTKKILITLLLGVAWSGVAFSSDQSEVEFASEPIESEENKVEKRRMGTPEVVLQLKYDDGELNKIYLAQFRKGIKSPSTTVSVPARLNLCSDLCHAGLGGEVCGLSCHQMIPIGLQLALDNGSSTESLFGEPRTDVCPTLCMNKLGEPLCNCHNTEEANNSVDWNAICAAFCASDDYVLGGCPSCEESSTYAPNVVQSFHSSSAVSRVLTTTEGWSAWCNVQCRQGQGGAACNCDKSPFL